MNRGIDARRFFPDNKTNEHPGPPRQDADMVGRLIHAYVLMGDHYHLQIETLKPNLS